MPNGTYITSITYIQAKCDSEAGWGGREWKKVCHHLQKVYGSQATVNAMGTQRHKI